MTYRPTLTHTEIIGISHQELLTMWDWPVAPPTSWATACGPGHWLSR